MLGQTTFYISEYFLNCVLFSMNKFIHRSCPSGYKHTHTHTHTHTWAVSTFFLRNEGARDYTVSTHTRTHTHTHTPSQIAAPHTSTRTLTTHLHGFHWQSPCSCRNPAIIRQERGSNQHTNNQAEDATTLILGGIQQRARQLRVKCGQNCN